MRKSRKLALVASACVAMLALAITGTVGVLNVLATGGLSDNVTVILIDPPPAASIVVFTDDGLAPASLPIEAAALVTPIDTGGGLPTVDSVDFVVNPAALDGTSTTADDVVAGVLDDGEWLGVVDLATADLSSPVVIAALARISGSYAREPVTAYDEYDSVLVSVTVSDGSAVDTNANSKPDAAGLAANPSGTFFGTGASGGQMISFWRPLDLVRATQLSQLLDTANGSVFVDVTGPTLSEIIAANGAYNIYNDGRLLVTLAALPEDLLDGPAGVRPLIEFGTGANVGREVPQNIFALVNILLRHDVNAPTDWTALVQVPPTSPVIVEIEGPGVAAHLAALGAGAGVYGYTYNTTFGQDASGNITDIGDQADWAEVLSFALSRDVVQVGDDTVVATFALASVIFGSNGAPLTTTLGGGAAGGGGGGGGTCFIATAAYGTPLANDINVLRAVRDSYMLNNAVGAAFVDTYYRLSPPVADAVANNALLKAAVRTLLTPVVIVSSFVLAMPGASLLLLLGCAALVVSRIRRRMTRV